MESESTYREALTEAERASAAPYLEYPATPWFPLAAGVWSAGMVLALTDLGEGEGLELHLPLLLVLLAVEVAFLGWYRRRRGTMPSMQHLPVEIRRELRRYAMGVVVVVAVVVAATALSGAFWGAAVAFATVTGGTEWHGRRYEAAAEETRSRLA